MFSLDTSFRLLSAEIDLIDTGMDIVLYHAGELNLSAYDQELSLRVKEIARAIRGIARRPKAKTHRVKLDALSIAVCMFALRCLAWESRKGNIARLRWPATVNRNGLLKKLEKHRKRAKRRALRAEDPSTYREWGVRWRRFVGWVRDKFRPIPVPTMLEYYRRRLDSVVAIVKGVLIEETNETLPADRELRKLVRAMCRHVRRERAAPVFMKDIHFCSPNGRAFIAQYMVRLIVRHFEETSPASPIEMSFQSPLTA